jgi:fumarate hydratase class II
MRIERDTLGEVEIPDDAMWGPQTQRAVDNFRISGQRFGRRFIEALGHVKRACALANTELGALPREMGEAIVAASAEVAEGRWDEHFPVDVFQTGSGTSTNMNANEVIANRATQLLGDGQGVHPNDHVNRGQSSNDVIPTAIHVAVTLAIRDDLVPALERLREALGEKARAFDHVVKVGRTHLQEATPIRLGQEFGGYERQAERSIERAEGAVAALRELPLGGTSVGTGVNRLPGFPARAIAHLNDVLGTDFVEAANHFEAGAARDGIVEAAGGLRTIAVSLRKIANDVRLLASGPSGLGEIVLPAVQPGSSIMPGKVNPVMAEALIMVTAQVVAHDAGIVLAGEGGDLELNTMMPLMGHNALTSIAWMGNAVRAFTDRCVRGIEVNEECCARELEHSTMLATALAPVIGYERAAEIAEEARRSGRTVHEVASEAGVLTPDELDALLDPRRMTEPDSE